jgi:hypothetical protein
MKSLYKNVKTTIVTYVHMFNMVEESKTMIRNFQKIFMKIIKESCGRTVVEDILKGFGT